MAKKPSEDNQEQEPRKEKSKPKQAKKPPKRVKKEDSESLQTKHASLENLMEALEEDEVDAQPPTLKIVRDEPAPEEKANEEVQLLDQLPMDPEDNLEEVTGEASPRLVSIIESLLFAAAKPLSIRAIRKILGEVTVHQVQLAMKHILDTTKDRGITLGQVAGGFQLRTHPDNAQWVHALLQAKPVRLSRPQLETVAIIAYRQPITRAEIDHVRGVDSGAVLRMLLDRDLIQIVGKKDEPGRPLVYGTTVHFLEFFNLKSLRELPSLREFSELSAESKATLTAKLSPSKTQEDLGQEVIDFEVDEVGS